MLTCYWNGWGSTDTTILVKADTSMQISSQEIRKYSIEIQTNSTERYITKLRASKASFILFETTPDDATAPLNRQAITKRILNDISVDSNLQHIYTLDQSKGICVCSQCQNRLNDDTIKLDPGKKYLVILFSKDAQLKISSKNVIPERKPKVQAASFLDDLLGDTLDLIDQVFTRVVYDYTPEDYESIKNAPHHFWAHCFTVPIENNKILAHQYMVNKRTSYYVPMDKGKLRKKRDILSPELIEYLKQHPNATVEIIAYINKEEKEEWRQYENISSYQLGKITWFMLVDEHIDRSRIKITPMGSLNMLYPKASSPAEHIANNRVRVILR
jgi:hypothetical protein